VSSYPNGSLHSIAEIISGFAFKSNWFGKGDDRVVRISDIQNGIINLDRSETFDSRQNAVSENFRVKKNDILMALSGATTGKIGIVDEKSEGGYLNQRVAIIRGKTPEAKKYLRHVFNGRYLEKLLLTAGGAAQANLSPKALAALEIPIPSPKEQRRLAEILDQAHQARRKRQEANRLTDQFLQSAFLKMFGDSLVNNRKWKLVRLGDLTDCLDNQRIPVTKKDRKPGPYPYYGASGIVDWVDKFIFNESLLLLAEDGENLRSRVKPVAFSIDGKTWVNNHAHVLRCRDVDRNFLKMILNRMDYSLYFAGATRPKITKSTMENFKIIYPPLDMRRKFAALEAKVESFHEKQTQSKLELETLFQSLVQKGFNGELAR